MAQQTNMEIAEGLMQKKREMDKKDPLEMLKNSAFMNLNEPSASNN